MFAWGPLWVSTGGGGGSRLRLVDAPRQAHQMSGTKVMGQAVEASEGNPVTEIPSNMRCLTVVLIVFFKIQSPSPVLCLFAIDVLSKRHT